jgi:hypothetical protein
LERYHAFAVHCGANASVRPFGSIEVEQTLLEGIFVDGLAVDANRSDSFAPAAGPVFATARNHGESGSWRWCWVRRGPYCGSCCWIEEYAAGSFRTAPLYLLGVLVRIAQVMVCQIVGEGLLVLKIANLAGLPEEIQTGFRHRSGVGLVLTQPGIFTEHCY